MSLALLFALFLSAPDECSELTTPPRPVLHDNELITIERTPAPLIHFSIGFRAPLSGERSFLGAVAAVIVSELKNELFALGIEGVDLRAEAGGKSLRIDGSCPLSALNATFAALQVVLDRATVKLPLSGSEPRLSKDDPRLLERAVKRLLSTERSRRANVDAEKISKWIVAHRSRMTIGVLGPIDSIDLDRLALRFSTTSTRATPIDPAPRAPANPRMVLVDVPGRQTAAILFVRRLSATSDSDAAAQAVLLEALGTGGKLRALLEPPSGAARDPYTATGPSRYGEAAIIGLEAAPKDVGPAIRDLLDAFTELRRETWAAEETAAARLACLERVRLDLARPDRVLAAAVDARLIDRPVDDTWKRLEALATVDHLALRRAGEGLLVEEGWQIVVLAEATPSLIGTMTLQSGALEVWAYDDLAELIR